MKAIVLSFGMLSFAFAGEKSLRSAEREQEQYAQIDSYIKNFNELFRLANENTSRPDALLNSKLLSHLSKDDKKFLFTSLVKDNPSNISLRRINSTVKIVHNSTGVTIDSFDVAEFSRTEKITYEGRSINLKEIFQKETLKDRAKGLRGEIAKVNDAKKSFAEKTFEAVFFVVTLPLNVLAACTTGQPPSGSDAALAGATPIYGAPTLRPFVNKGDPGGFERSNCIGYRDAKGKCYGPNGHAL